MLDRYFPHGQTTLKAGILRWTGELHPSEVSRSYLVDIRYAQPRFPNVLVRRPRLVPDTDGRLPHIYRDGSLCLHEPGQWAPGDPIAKTILPWTCEWLLHYEFWLATGAWHGSGGDHTSPIGKLTTPRRRRLRPRRRAHLPAVQNQSRHHRSQCRESTRSSRCKHATPASSGVKGEPR